MIKIIERLYYILAVIITEPFQFIIRKNLTKKIWDDWFNNTNNNQAFQKLAIRKVIKCALKTKYYKSLQADEKLISNPQLSDFPIISKDDIKNDADNFINTNKWIAHTKKNTGGSTGRPFEFYDSLYTRQLELAHQTFFYNRYRCSKGKTIYSFDGVRISNRLKQKNIFWKRRLRNSPYGSLRMAAIELNHSTAIHYINKILRSKPSFIRGYPSSITLIAEIVTIMNLQDKFSFLNGIMLSSEKIEEYQIEKIRQAFGCPVLPQYGMTEACAFGFTNSNELLYYCSPFYGITEILDDHGKHVAEGDIGEIILTSFGNTYQPFLRYKTGDIAQYGGAKNGFTVLTKLMGRIQDYIIGSDHSKIMLIGLIFGAHLSAFKAIKIWQIIQSIPGQIELRIQPEINWNKRLESEIIEILNCNKKIQVKIIYTDQFVLTSTGKRHFVVQNIKI